MKNEILNQYIINNLTPKKEHRKRIKKLYEELKSYLGDDKCFQTGSYARFTAIRPVNDLDVFYIFRDGITTFGAIQELPKLAERLENEFSKRCSEHFDVEIQTHSIKLEFDDEFSIDVVPAVETDKKTEDFQTNIYIVPNEETGEWISSDPKGYKELTKSVDEKSERNLRRAVRFVKSWKKGCKTCDKNFKLKSFHIEQIFIEAFQNNPDMELYDAIRVFFEELPANLLRARFIDRADDSLFIDQYVNELSTLERNKITNFAESQLNKIEEMESLTDENKILELICEVIACQENTSNNPSTDGFTPSGQHVCIYE